MLNYETQTEFGTTLLTRFDVIENFRYELFCEIRFVRWWKPDSLRTCC